MSADGEAAAASGAAGPSAVQRRPRLLPVAAVLAAALVVAIGFAVSAGATAIPLDAVWKIAGNRLVPGLFEADWSSARERIVWDLRLPRALLAVLTGAGLALSGAALQATTRNVLADPFLLGVSAGAALGAVAVISHLGDFAGLYSLPLMAFLGGILSLCLLLGALGRDGGSTPERVILAGVAISFLLMAGTNLLIFLGDQRAAHSVVFWMLGGLGRARWDQLWVPACVIAAGGLWLLAIAPRLNAMMMGEEAAYALGVPAARLRLAVLVVTALMTSVLVAITGAIGFVGLVVPHILRAWIGGDNRRLLPLCALGGALFMVLVDIAARTAVAPQEMPIGVVTGGLGGAYFTWLMARRR